jgi:hypothetical protein
MIGQAIRRKGSGLGRTPYGKVFTDIGKKILLRRNTSVRSVSAIAGAIAPDPQVYRSINGTSHGAYAR